MRRFSLYLLMFASVSVWGKGKEIDYLAACLKEAGGLDRFERVETVDWSFSVARPSPQGVVTFTGRQRLKRGETGFILREDLETPNGRWTLWTGASPSVMKDGVLVPHEADWEDRLTDAQQRAFWALVPFSLVDESEKGRYLGSGYFRSRLARRVEIAPPSGEPVGLSTPVVLYFDTDAPLFRGISYGTGDTATTLLFENHERIQNLVSTPSQWTRFNAEDKRLEFLRVHSVVFNSFIDDQIYTASAQGDTSP